MAKTPVPLGFKTPWGRVTGWFENDVGDQFFLLADGCVALLQARHVEDAWWAFLEAQRGEFEKAHA